MCFSIFKKLSKIKKNTGIKKSTTKEYNPNECFICGCELYDTENDDGYTVEHVIPQWIQEDFGIRVKRVGFFDGYILNKGHALQYKKMTVPCCRKCNSKMSSMFEDPIKKAVKNGYLNTKALDDNILFLWATKISYGLAYKELVLKKDITDKYSEQISTLEKIEERENEKMFLQAAIYGNHIDDDLGSVFVFSITDVDKSHYHFADLPNDNFLSIELGDIGIVICTSDSGILKKALLNCFDLNGYVSLDWFHVFCTACRETLNYFYGFKLAPMYAFDTEEKGFSIYKNIFANQSELEEKICEVFEQNLNRYCN